MSVFIESSGSINLSNSYPAHSSHHLPEARISVLKGRFIKAGIAVAACMQAIGAGGFLFEHGVAFYAYCRNAPSSLFMQYFYANAAHEAAEKILNQTIFGFSASSVATAAFSATTGILVIKLGVGIYNLTVEEEKKIPLSFLKAIQTIFSSLFSWFRIFL